jgi:hypothetical protein
MDPTRRGRRLRQGSLLLVLCLSMAVLGATAAQAQRSVNVQASVIDTQTWKDAVGDALNGAPDIEAVTFTSFTDGTIRFEVQLANRTDQLVNPMESVNVQLSFPGATGPETAFWYAGIDLTQHCELWAESWSDFPGGPSLHKVADISCSLSGGVFSTTLPLQQLRDAVSAPADTTVSFWVHTQIGGDPEDAYPDKPFGSVFDYANPPPPPPHTVDVVPSGTVLVRAPGTTSFVPLTAAEQIPYGTEVDVTHGRVAMRTSYDTRGTFSGGRFVLKGSATITELRLSKWPSGTCARTKAAARSPATAAKSKKPIRSLWGKSNGRVRTRGKYASATVRGTYWLTQDRCDGTLVKVFRGKVRVRDFHLKKTLTVKARHSYLAHTP